MSWLAADEGGTVDGARRRIDGHNAIAATSGTAWHTGVNFSRRAAVDQIVRGQGNASDEIGWRLEGRRGFNLRAEPCEEWGGDDVKDTDDEEERDSPSQVTGEFIVIHDLHLSHKKGTKSTNQQKIFCALCASCG